jgi:hypothetical protein
LQLAIKLRSVMHVDVNLIFLKLEH